LPAGDRGTDETRAYRNFLCFDVKIAFQVERRFLFGNSASAFSTHSVFVSDMDIFTKARQGAKFVFNVGSIFFLIVALFVY